MSETSKVKDSRIDLRVTQEQKELLEKAASRLFWFLCGNEVYTDSLFNKIVLKVFPSKHFTIS